jgi:hypothetical protein
MPNAPGGPVQERHLARCVEQAASHQTRALAWLREARDPASPLSSLRRRALFTLAVEHLLLARHLLERARKATRDPALTTQLNSHLDRLATIVASAEERLHQADRLAAAGDVVLPPSAANVPQAGRG